MRTHLYALALCGVLACSDDDPRGTVDIAQNPSTALDDAGEAQTRPTDAGRPNLIGSGTLAPGAAKPRRDAGTPMDAGIATDASAPDSGSQYACQTANDCAIRDVGSCCGYYPRCANANAIFTPPVCNGTAGVCGFPVIDSCGCERGRCVSLQAGVPISP